MLLDLLAAMAIMIYALVSRSEFDQRHISLLLTPVIFHLPSPCVAFASCRLFTYHWRANAIRKRGSGPYDDRLGASPSLSKSTRVPFGSPHVLPFSNFVFGFSLGPTLLCVALLIAILVNFILRVSSEFLVLCRTRFFFC